MVQKQSTDNAFKVNLSLYQRHVDKVNRYVKEHKKYNGSNSKFVQEIIDNYGEDTGLKRYVSTYLIYPIILCSVGLFGAVSTQNLIEILVKQSLYFDELYVLNRVFTIISFGFLSVLMASFYIMKKKIEDN